MVNVFHMDIHNFVGSVEGHTHFNPSTGEPEVDPLFPLFHTFIEYLRLMRQDCYDFDTVSSNDLDAHIPYVYGTSNMTLDYVMTFSVLCDGSSGQRKRLCSDQDITPRLMMDISPNTDFGIVYELGDFWNEDSDLSTACSDSLNTSWWSNADLVSSETGEEFERDGALWMVTTTPSIATMMWMVAAVVAVAVLRWCAVAMRRNKTVEDMTAEDVAVREEAVHYGTV